MMSVASKTKTKIFSLVIVGFVVALSALPTWASTPIQPDIEPISSQQDLSMLRTRLKERFSWIRDEVRLLIGGKISQNADDQSVRVIDVTQWIGNLSPSVDQNIFVDIENDPYVSYITRLAAYGVLSSTSRFYPQNYFRVDDFISLFARLYKKTTGQSLTSQEILGMTSQNGLMTKWMMQQMMYAVSSLDPVVIDGNPYDTLVRSEWAYYLVRMFDLPPTERALPHWVSPILSNTFTDISTHPLASAITILANLGIVNTQTTKFYPDNYLRHYDFVVLMVNAFLASKSSNYTVPSVSFSPFSDVEVNASYLPQLVYASDRGLIDMLIVNRDGQLYFSPNDFVTKKEVYAILTKLLPINIIYDQQLASNQKISRAELAQLLVDSFQLVPKNISSDPFGWMTLDTWDISLLTKVKTLLSLL